MTTFHCDGPNSLPPLVGLHCAATQATVRRDRQILSARLGYPSRQRLLRLRDRPCPPAMPGRKPGI
jgi:hypothetical protein